MAAAKENEANDGEKGDLVRLVITPPFDGELVCGATRYPVKDGVVHVAPHHVDHARQAGYRAE